MRGIPEELCKIPEEQFFPEKIPQEFLNYS
jgi:hypothetical protein